MKYINFVEVGESKSGLTKIWDITSIQSNVWLGSIKWHSPWRKYVFFPTSFTLLDAKCLEEILEFLKAKMDERK